MAIIDNTLAAQIPTFDPAAPLQEAAKIQNMQAEAQAAQFKQNQTEMGAEMRGIQPFVNTPEFPQKWAQAADRLRQRGVIDDQMHQQWANSPSPLLMKSIIAKTEDPALSFRKEEAVREQGNTDRSFLQQKTQSDRTYGLAVKADARADEGPVEETQQRMQAAKVAGLDTATPQGRTFALTGKMPEADASFGDTISNRTAAATKMGLSPDDPGFKSYVLTGKMPREDAQPLTATDKKAILEADEKVQSGRQTIDNLNKAKLLSKEAMSGPWATKRGYAASFLGETSDTGKAGVATQDLENLVTSNALQQLRSIFGGNPTEGERGILLDIQGSVNKPDNVRQKIYDRAIEAADKRLKFEQQRADELRGGSFYKGQGGTSKASTLSKPITQAEYQKLESGATFTAPDGSQRVKP